MYIAEYPDATYAPNGLTICNEIVFEDAGLFGIDGVINSDEIVWAHFNLIQPLNARVRGAAMANNWTLVGSIEKDFATHGYCSSPSERRWIRRFGDSLEIQADDRGTLHPNIYGHDVYAKRIAAALEPIRARAAALPGDLNLDGKVDCSDLKTVRDLLGKRMGQLGFDPIADLNQDGMIDLTDLAIVAQNLPAGARCP